MSLLLAIILVSQAAPSPEPVSASENKKEERKICRREMSAAGLHRSKRVCLTAAEWKEREGRGNEEGMSEAGTRR
jgi:hypothetical protein